MLEHISDERTAHDRGLRFGEVQRGAVEGTLAAYERLFREACGLNAAAVRSFGERIGECLGGAHPEAREEIAAIARGVGVDEDFLLAVNARTELLAGASPAECSAIGVLPERRCGHTLLAQNWDWCFALDELRFEISEGAPCRSPYRDALTPGAATQPQPL